jgi:hypothetical protein
MCCCGASPGTQPTQSVAPHELAHPEKILGIWKMSFEGGENVLTLRRDAKAATFSLVLKGGINRTQSGTWKLEKSVLTLKTLKSTSETQIGNEKRFDVAELNDTDLVLVEPDDATDSMRFRRQGSVGGTGK